MQIEISKGEIKSIVNSLLSLYTTKKDNEYNEFIEEKPYKLDDFTL